jgi:hypothetical protein
MVRQYYSLSDIGGHNVNSLLEQMCPEWRGNRWLQPDNILHTVVGTSETSAFDETSPSGNDYLSEVCAWGHKTQ